MRFSIKEEEEKKSSINNIIIMGSYEDAKRKAHVMKFKKYIKSLSKPQKVGLILTLCSFVLLLLYLVIDNHDTLFIMAEFVHFIGIAILAYKLLREKSCLGLSMQTQELTAIFLGIRLYCSFMMEYDWHTILDFLTLMATMWVLSTMKGSLKHNYETHNRPLDTIMTWQVLVPCVIMAIIAHPQTSHAVVNRVLWATCVYLEAVSVLPQLRVMQSVKVVERWTANYVFSLGVARFLSCAHWILQIFDGQSYLKTALTTGLWPVMVLVSEIVQTFILADFCYFYVLSFADGGKVVRLPAGLV